MATTTTLQTVPSADGTRIAYERTGSGQPLVLVHGTTADHTRWEPVLPAFTEEHAVYAMDRRGRGESGDAAEYDLAREVEDIVAVVESIGEPIALLGHSYGGLCSLEATLRTDDVDRLVLYEPPLPVGDLDRDTEPMLDEMESLIEAGEREDALVLFLGDVAGMPPAEIDALRSAPNWPARVEAVHTVVREERARKAYAFEAARFAELTTPTLLLLGGDTAPLHRNATEALDDALPNSQVVVLPGQAHAAMNTAPDLFADEVRAFLDESE